MGLLLDIPYAGASADYLYARIRCRRRAMLAGGFFCPENADSPQQVLLREYRWVYRQANNRLRNLLLPIFEYFELRQLVICLRYLAAKNHSALTARLKQSLFQSKLRSIVEQAGQVTVALTGLEEQFGQEYPAFRKLSKSYLRQGPGGLEQVLIGGHLAAALNPCKEPQVQRFLGFLLDMRNLQAVHKHLRWQVQLAPPVFAGGTLDERVLEKLWREQDRAGLQRLAKEFARQKEPPVGEQLEAYLMEGVSKQLHSEGREPLQIGVVIDYLWRCQLTAREQGVALSRNGQMLAETVTGTKG